VSSCAFNDRDELPANSIPVHFVFDPTTSGAAQAPAEVVIAEQARQSLRQRGGVIGRDEEPRLALSHSFGGAAAARGHDGKPTCTCFEVDNAEPLDARRALRGIELCARGQYKDGGAAVNVRQFGIGGRGPFLTQETNGADDSEITGEFLQCRARRTVADNPVFKARRQFQQRRQRAQNGVDSFARNEPGNG